MQREAAAYIKPPETTRGRRCRAEEVQSKASSSTDLQAHACTHTHTHIYAHIHTHTNAPSNSVRLICFGYSIIFLVEYLKNQVKPLH